MGRTSEDRSMLREVWTGERLYGKVGRQVAVECTMRDRNLKLGCTVSSPPSVDPLRRPALGIPSYVSLFRSTTTRAPHVGRRRSPGTQCRRRGRAQGEEAEAARRRGRVPGQRCAFSARVDSGMDLTHHSSARACHSCRRAKVRAAARLRNGCAAVSEFCLRRAASVRRGDGGRSVQALRFKRGGMSLQDPAPRREMAGGHDHAHGRVDFVGAPPLGETTRATG